MGTVSLGLFLAAMATPAGAWEAEVLQPPNTDAGTNGIRVVQWNGQPAVLVVGDGGLEVRAAMDGETLLALDTPVRDAAVLDVDRDDRSDLVLCGAELSFWNAASQRPLTLVDEPCDAVEVDASMPDNPRLWVAGASSYTLSRGPGEAVQTAWADPLPSGSRLVHGGKVVAHWHPESTAWHLRAGAWTSTTRLATPPSAVALGPQGWGWLAGGQWFTGADGTVVEASEATGVLSDGQRLWWVEAAHNRVRLVGSEPSVVSLPVRPDWAALGDLNGDGCPDLVALSREGEGVRVIGRCDAPAPAPEMGTAEDETDAPASPAVLAPEPAAPVDAEAGRLEMGPEWTAVSVSVGETLDLELFDPKGRAHGFRTRGGPAGLQLEDRRLTNTPVPSDVGLWRVKVRVQEGASAYWTGIDLTVTKAP